ncbi:MAG: hypothetical protein CME63_11480 [Halobacteriovoraceae bacterium]|nr:hypothetical protein [Halobacteriovoraceae bacterium]|tara:strand:+ start:1519 stop:2007 length:489 start_codon:yes stop_codon:yes gene_type:complete
MTTHNNKKKDPTSIDVDSIDLERMKTLVSDAPGKSEYAVERGGTSFAPTQEGAIKSRAFKVMDEQISMQMDNIMEQIQVLAKQAEDLKSRRILSEQIYSAKIKFEPLVGDIYYLYNSPQGRILSILSPSEFGEKKLEDNKYEFLAKARLLADCTWQILEGQL